MPQLRSTTKTYFEKKQQKKKLEFAEFVQDLRCLQAQ